ncbi:uncharacterized protein PgNI_07061 [Pyricularia grisea]|uniref:UNC-45/Cro1/She4 central domain-containing protein n=1 Tax=Pyricularia grisea TaxID=148305 RepID=A0A6P8B147_PYRGI|nr:uncharacterized protein PgNI_07061 [Pyricularia grisea]TLD08620.1 hypothetical protein PgNI_07061 [Pyricularia grisea]
MASPGAATKGSSAEPSKEDQVLILMARLMEGGQEDEETCKDLNQLTKLLNDDINDVKSGKPSICDAIDSDCVDTLLGYLDMRQPEAVRGFGLLTTSAYLKAAGDDGNKKLSEFYYDRVKRGTYDDYIVAFCVASALFPIVPDLIKDLFLSEGFLASLGPLMRRKWKSRKVETACLEMLNAACMNSECRAAVQKYCAEWLEEIVDQDPEEIAKCTITTEPDVHQAGSISMRKHSEQVQNLAAVILTKLKATQPPESTTELPEERVGLATTSVEDLSKKFTKVLLEDPEHGRQSAIEGLAYASLQPKVKESLSEDKVFLKSLVETLKNAPPRSSLTYGALSIVVNLTRYEPPQSEEQKRMTQLKAYANAAGKLKQDPLNNDDHVNARCMRVFEAGIVPILVSHSKDGSVASLSLIVQIIYSISVTPKLRGQLAQQGAVRLLIAAWTALSAANDASTVAARRTAAQALARILISTNPAHVFGGTRPTPISAAIRPLASIVPPDDSTETRDLLPTFEALMALTNLASTEDQDTRRAIVRAVFPDLEEQVLSSNSKVQRAATELICNLAQCPEGAAPFADGSPQASTRVHILLALCDAEDEGTRNAAGGTLANLSAHEAVVRAILARGERGIQILLGMCGEGSSEDLRQRGAFVLLNMAATEGETGQLSREKIKAENGATVLTECAKKTRRPEVLEIAVAALKALLEAE